MRDTQDRVEAAKAKSKTLHDKTKLTGMNKMKTKSSDWLVLRDTHILKNQPGKTKCKKQSISGPGKCR